MQTPAHSTLLRPKEATRGTCMQTPTHRTPFFITLPKSIQITTYSPHTFDHHLAAANIGSHTVCLNTTPIHRTPLHISPPRPIQVATRVPVCRHQLTAHCSSSSRYRPFRLPQPARPSPGRKYSTFLSIFFPLPLFPIFSSPAVVIPPPRPSVTATYLQF
jgi:hypothetical protein